jgi:hypothetical protein
VPTFKCQAVAKYVCAVHIKHYIVRALRFLKQSQLKFLIKFDRVKKVVKYGVLLGTDLQ